MAFNEALTIRGEPTVCEREDDAVFRRVTIDAPAWKITTFTTFIHSTCLHKHLEKGTQTHCTSTETVYTYADGCKQAHTLKLSQRWMFRVYEECRLQIFMPRLSRCLRKGNDSLAVFTPLLHHNLLSILCFFSLSLCLYNTHDGSLHARSLHLMYSTPLSDLPKEIKCSRLLPSQRATTVTWSLGYTPVCAAAAVSLFMVH